MKAPLLEVSGLHKRFGTRVLFDDTGLVLHAGPQT